MQLFEYVTYRVCDKLSIKTKTAKKIIYPHLFISWSLDNQQVIEFSGKMYFNFQSQWNHAQFVFQNGTKISAIQSLFGFFKIKLMIIETKCYCQEHFFQRKQSFLHSSLCLPLFSSNFYYIYLKFLFLSQFIFCLMFLFIHFEPIIVSSRFTTMCASGSVCLSLLQTIS